MSTVIGPIGDIFPHWYVYIYNVYRLLKHDINLFVHSSEDYMHYINLPMKEVIKCIKNSITNSNCAIQ